MGLKYHSKENTSHVLVRKLNVIFKTIGPFFWAHFFFNLVTYITTCVIVTDKILKHLYIYIYDLLV